LADTGASGGEIRSLLSVDRTATDTGYKEPGKKNMLYTLAVILLVAWLLGMVSSATMGGFIHILLVVAIVLVLVRLIQGRKVL
jgi:hypothetical protein